MSKNNIIIDLKAKKDIDGRTYFVGKLKSPVMIDCYHGATFLIFIADQGAEQLQIAPMDDKSHDNTF